MVHPTTPPAPFVIAVLNQKGGVGKSTLATNLAAVAHLRGRRTMVLDLDRQGSAFDWYSARADTSKLAGLGVARADKALSLPKFRELTKGYAVVVADGPPRLSDVTRAAAVAADVVVIPIRAGAFDWWACAETLELLDGADAIRVELGRGPVRRLFVLNGVAPNTHIAKHAAVAVSDFGELAPVMVHNRVVYASAATTGEAVLTTEPHGPAAAEMVQLFNLCHSGQLEQMVNMGVQHA